MVVLFKICLKSYNSDDNTSLWRAWGIVGWSWFGSQTCLIDVGYLNVWLKDILSRLYDVLKFYKGGF